MKKIFYLAIFIALSALIAVKASANSPSELSLLPIVDPNDPIDGIELEDTPTPTILQFKNMPTSTPTPTTLEIHNVPVATITTTAGNAQLKQTPTPQPTPILTPTTIILDKDTLTKAAQEHEQNLKVIDFTPIIDTDEINKAIKEEINELDNNLVEEMAESAKDNQELQKFVNERLDADSSKEEMQYWINSSRSAELCISYFESLFNTFIKENFNKSKIYDERADKLGVAYSLYKTQYDGQIPWEVNGTFWRLLDDIHKFGRRARSNISIIRDTIRDYNGRSFLAPLPDDLHCKTLANDYWSVTDISIRKDEIEYYVWAQSNKLNWMKNILAQFNEEHPFSEEFVKEIKSIYGYGNEESAF